MAIDYLDRHINRLWWSADNLADNMLHTEIDAVLERSERVLNGEDLWH